MPRIHFTADDIDDQMLYEVFGDLVKAGLKQRGLRVVSLDYGRRPGRQRPNDATLKEVSDEVEYLWDRCLTTARRLREAE